MKKFLFLFAGLLLSGIIVNATVRTVSNHPLHPAQYTTINSAIQESSPGDTILVFGSGWNYSYGTVNIDREVVLIGAGYNNPHGNLSRIGSLNFTAGTFYSSHSFVSGFHIENLYYYGNAGADKLLEGIIVERCRLQYVIFNHSVLYRDNTIRNCLISNSHIYFYAYSSPYENIQIYNNIFDNQYITARYSSHQLDSVYFRNNVFVNRKAPNRIFDKTKWLTMENNIFLCRRAPGMY